MIKADASPELLELRGIVNACCFVVGVENSKDLHSRVKAIDKIAKDMYFDPDGVEALRRLRVWYEDAEF